MPRKWFLIILAIVIIPISMTCWKIVQYAKVSKTQLFQLHRHIVNALSLNTANYFERLNLRLAFAPLLVRSQNWSEQLAVLNNAQMSNNDFACLSLLTAEGKEKVKVFAAAAPFFGQRLDYSKNTLFLHVQKTQSPDTGPAYETAGLSLFDILYPLESGQWMFVAVRWDSLKKVLFEQQVGKEGYIWLLDESGRVIGDSKGTQGGESSHRWAFFNDRLQEFKQSSEGFPQWRGEFEDPLGQPMVGAAAWVRSAGWMILSVQPQREAYAEARQLRLSAFFWVLCSFLGMGVFGYFWVRHISFPITRLASGVASVARRKFDEKVPEDFGLDEFRALGHAFNQMMLELRTYNDMQVEKIVEEKTTVQSLLFSIRDGIVMLNENGEIVFANEPARQWALEVAGHGKKEFDKAWQSLQEYPPWADLLRPVLDKEKPNGSEEFEFPVQGRPRWARVLAQQVLTENGRRIGVMVVIRDITQDKELDRIKEDFFNGITHDLRTPLAATIGYLGLSEMQVPQDHAELGTLVGSARQSAKRALSLVETILSLARLQAGKLTINPVPLQVQPLLKKIASDLSFQAAAKKLTLTHECNDPTLWTSADASLLERVIENLTGNAIKYTMEKGWVKLIARAVPEGVEIAVQDNGRGIPAEALKSLFGKFQQVKAEDRSVGFGIGLSFSKGIVEAHGSAIRVESEVGKGSRFFFVLERVAAPHQTTSAAA